MNHFKVNNSEVFYTFTKLSNCHLYLVLNISITLKVKAVTE